MTTSASTSSPPHRSRFTVARVAALVLALLCLAALFQTFPWMVMRYGYETKRTTAQVLTVAHTKLPFTVEHGEKRFSWLPGTAFRHSVRSTDGTILERLYTESSDLTVTGHSGDGMFDGRWRVHSGGWECTLQRANDGSVVVLESAHRIDAR